MDLAVRIDLRTSNVPIIAVVVELSSTLDGAPNLGGEPHTIGGPRGCGALHLEPLSVMNCKTGFGSVFGLVCVCGATAVPSSSEISHPTCFSLSSARCSHAPADAAFH